jgi:hypothetical protein
MALRELQLSAPVVRTGPPVGALVNLDFWLHVDGTEVPPATATVPGLAATVRAEFVEARWDLGEGRVTCSSPGAVYDPVKKFEEQSTDCKYRYRRSSGDQPRGVYEASVTVVWHLRWSATDGEAGDLGEVERTADFGVPVNEVEALVCANPGCAP